MESYFAIRNRIEAPDRSIVISGDTRPTQSIVDTCNGCDILVHAVYNGETRMPAGDSVYFRRFHTSALELGDIAMRARPRVLVFYDQVFFGARPAGLIRQGGYDVPRTGDLGARFGRLLRVTELDDSLSRSAFAKIALSLLCCRGNDLRVDNALMYCWRGLYVVTDGSPPNVAQIRGEPILDVGGFPCEAVYRT